MNSIDQFVFFGTGGLLSSTCLKSLLENGRKPNLVIMQTVKDSPYPNLTELVCQEYDLNLLFVTSVNEDKTIHALKQGNYSLGIVASFAEIFKKELLQLFPILNVHMGVLPFYRGAYTNFWKIMANDDIYGVTIHKMEEKIDSGATILIEEQDFSREVFAGEFFRKNYEMAGQALLKALDAYKAGEIKSNEDNHDQGKYYRKHHADDMVLDPNESVKNLYKKINRLQFYGNPTMNGLRLYSAELLLELNSTIDTFELLPVNPCTTILKNQSGILLLRHHNA